jgi:hypothetical protein
MFRWREKSFEKELQTGGGSVNKALILYCIDRYVKWREKCFEKGLQTCDI